MQPCESLESRRLFSGDFNGDDNEDLVVHDTQTGAVRVLTLSDNKTVTSQTLIAAVGSQWRIAAIGNLDDDLSDDVDILWHNAALGRLVAWQMNGTSISGYRTYPHANPNSWTFLAAGEHDDPSGPDDMDLLWQNKVTGGLALWHMNGNQIDDFRIVGAITNPALKVVGMSEVRGGNNGPYDLELLVRNESSSQNAIWRINDNQVQSQISLPPAGPAWRVAGYIDADNDNPGDVIWQNRTTGQMVEWELNDQYQVADRNPFPTVGANKLVSIGG